jgi:hypothetical protein
MTSAHFPRRRVLTLCLATAMLHYAAIGWVATHVGAAAQHAPPPPPPPIVAQLRLASPQRQAAPVASVALAAAKPVRKVVHKFVYKRPALELAPAAVPLPVLTQEMQAAPEVALAAGAGADASPAKASDKAAPATAAAVPDAVPAEQQPAPAQAAPAARRFKVDLPPSAELSLDVERTDADGTRWHGVGAMQWHLGGNAYKLTLTAGLSLLVAHINLIVSTSEGLIDESGIAPVLATEKRRGRAQTATHFNRQDGRITFSASEASFALSPGAQDKASLPLQLAGIGRADPSQLSGDIEILIGEEREADVFRFVVVGQEEIETALGKLQTWHLSRPPRAGSYNSKLDIWLAPAQGWYPVQIRNTESNGAITTQLVTRIALSDLGQSP